MFRGDFARIHYKYYLAEKYAENRDLERLSSVNSDIVKLWKERSMNEDELELVDGYEKKIDIHVRDWFDSESLGIWEYAWEGKVAETTLNAMNYLEDTYKLRDEKVVSNEFKSYVKDRMQEACWLCHSKTDFVYVEKVVEDSEGIMIALGGSDFLFI